MGKGISATSFLTITLFLLCSTNLVYPQAKKGGTEAEKVGQKTEQPPGWEKGLKKGWEKSTPPGWENWSERKKKKWEKCLAKAKKKINARAEKKGWVAKDKEKATIALELLARKGVPVGFAKNFVQKCIGQGLKGEETLKVCVNFSEGVDKGLPFKTLGKEVVKKIKAGYRGEKLANEIHAMIEERYKAKMKAQAEKVGKPVGKKELKLWKEERKHQKQEKIRKPEKKEIEKPEIGRPRGRGPVGGKGRCPRCR